jgi:DNA mismatch repair protein MutL
MREGMPAYRDVGHVTGPESGLEKGRLAANKGMDQATESSGGLSTDASAGTTGEMASIPHGTTSRPHGTTSRPHGTTSRALQIHSRYLVTETDEGLEIIDQHALHERILYEQLREKVLAETMESQRMLVPEPIDLAASEAAAVLENRQMLARLGIEIDPFGGDTVLLTAYPAMLAHFNPVDLLHGLIEKLVEKLLMAKRSPDSGDLLDELLHTMACKGAVKYGDRLTSEEIGALLAHRHLVQDHHHCPHGRPTTLVFTRQQLDRQFKRSK